MQENYKKNNLINIKHHFLIRYIDEKQKNKMVELVLKLIKNLEIGDFYIEESKAYKENKIKYNYHTIVSDKIGFKYDLIEKNILKFL